MAASADQPQAIPRADEHHAVAVILDFVKPVGTCQNFVGVGGERKLVQHGVPLAGSIDSRNLPELVS
jgi:hypothetical protein